MTKNNINYANQYGLKAARNKIKDPKKLEEFIQAYCDKFGLDKISIENALKAVSEVNAKVSLASKYTAICESIKRSPSGTSSVSISSQTAANKHYLKAAASTLSYVRGLCINNTYNQTTVNSRINGISNYSKDTTSLTTEYKSCMQIHAGDMKGYIQSGKDVEFASKEQALEFINKKYSHLNQEVAGSRSKEGWHFDSHSINNSTNNIDHINLYTKKYRVHITWRREK